MIRSCTLAFVLALSFPSASHAFLAENGLVVEPGPARGFDVPYRGRSGTAAFWCAAGDYVTRGLGLSPVTRIYRTSSGPRRSGDAIRFSLEPEGAKRPGLFIWSEDKGLTASFARQFCDTPGNG